MRFSSSPVISSVRLPMSGTMMRMPRSYAGDLVKCGLRAWLPQCVIGSVRGPRRVKDFFHVTS